jgi:hypothetical protein
MNIHPNGRDVESEEDRRGHHHALSYPRRGRLCADGPEFETVKVQFTVVVKQF